MKPFLESELSAQELLEGLFEVIPVPFEKSVSYGTGTARAPEAILEASSQLERWTGSSMPADAGIVTAPPIVEDDAKTMVQLVSERVIEVLTRDRVPVLIGGEHTVSVGAFRSLEAMRSLEAPRSLETPVTTESRKEEIGILQIDAHADLRPSYEGSPLSHACVMHRALDMGLSFYQTGVRSLSREEDLLRRALQAEKPERYGFLDGPEAFRGSITELTLPRGFPRSIYLTIDIDGLDPSIFPSTGTPEPGGLGWYQTLDMISSVAKEREIIGFDLVELAPVPHRHADPFAAARLIYEVMGLVMGSRKNRGIR